MWIIAYAVAVLFGGFSLIRSHLKEGPPVTGRLIKLRSYWMSQKTGRGDALRKEKGVFAYFCRRMDKSKASGSTRTADFKVLFSPFAPAFASS